ncbi:hypothetical protein BGZ63DRAFT_373249 [Mariannaea sp. PMI_226]|nr:hypothetical protein BGZ63DRAFT_373249 [Mariannaea sp. PMI_226]
MGFSFNFVAIPVATLCNLWKKKKRASSSVACPYPELAGPTTQAKRSSKPGSQPRPQARTKYSW